MASALRTVTKTVIPNPTPFVPDVPTFLTLIGRDLKQHSSKIPSWDALFSLSSPELRDLGISNARQRRYLLRWRENFRKGFHGPGGDLKYVTDGVAEMRLVEIDKPNQPGTVTLTPGKTKKVVNTPVGAKLEELDIHTLPEVKMAWIKKGHLVSGSRLEPVKGTSGMVARLAVKEGLWEDKRGVKVDGGERRQAEVRAKKRLQEKSAR